MGTRELELYTVLSEKLTKEAAANRRRANAVLDEWHFIFESSDSKTLKEINLSIERRRNPIRLRGCQCHICCLTLLVYASYSAGETSLRLFRFVIKWFELG